MQVAAFLQHDDRAILPLGSADYIEPGVILHGSRAAVVVGEIDGRITQRVREIRDAWLDFDDRAIVMPNIWGYQWAEEAYGAMLFATALTNESIAGALASPKFHLWTSAAESVASGGPGLSSDRAFASTTTWPSASSTTSSARSCAGHPVPTARRRCVSADSRAT